MSGGSFIKKTYVFLIIILIINSSRYLTYLIEGNNSLYYISMFILNIIGLVVILISLLFNKK
ncbi:hypothetical protein FGB90_14660 [Alteribacter natronophilus]|nr:hypothetical protein FGB90_14660 [Alteribacter natronophilus]